LKHRNEILATINIAHHFGSAFTEDQVYGLLRQEIDRNTYQSVIDELLEENVIFNKNRCLHLKEVESIESERKKWSRDLFKKNKKYLRLICQIPWIKFLGLTGANAFESCSQDDDIDLFVITSKNRLWLCYLTLVVLSKFIGKRGCFCINFLVDENNLEIREKNYFTAVQIVQMKTLNNDEFHRKLVNNNKWIFKILPNAGVNFQKNGFYLLSKNGTRNRRTGSSQLLTKLNKKIYLKYSRRLMKKFPDSFGSGIVLSEGYAKLNRIDNQHIYDVLLDKFVKECTP
jgi:hypothetical protein